jgi:predicted phage terminase large subunit-like protein
MVLETRLNNDAQICLTFTRWRHDDIAGHLIKLQDDGITSDEWTIVRFEGILEHNPDQHLDDPRELGEALWPEEHSQEKLLNVKSKNPTAFEALYQQRPTPKSGNMVKREWFKNYEIHELPDGVNHIYMDTAQSEKELTKNDPTGILIFREWKNDLYLIHFTKGRWSLPELSRKVQQVAGNWLQGRNSRIYIENKSNARSLRATLKEETRLSIILDNIKGGKMERLENELPTIESGRVYIPLSESWTEDFLLHVCGFPLMTHDEEVDCLTGAIRKGLGKETGLKFGRPATR